MIKKTDTPMRRMLALRTINAGNVVIDGNIRGNALTRSYSWLMALVFGAAFFFGTPSAKSQVPGAFTYQGLLEENGAPIPSTTNATFTVTITDQNHNPIYTETFQNVVVTDGIFNLVLGNGGTSPFPFPSTMTFNEPYFLQVDVTTANGPTTLPPTAIYSAPYAINSGTVNGIQASLVPVAGELFPVPIGAGYTGSAKIDPAFLPSNIPNNLLATAPITTINLVSPNSNGSFLIDAGPGITITPGPNDITISSAGEVTSVNGSGGTTGLTLAGGPITTSGTLTLGGTLKATNGGTGLATIPAHSVLIGEGTSTLAVATPSTAGYILTSNGATTDPTWQAPNGGVLSVTNVASDGTLSISPTTGNVQASLALGHANIWTATQTFPATNAEGSALANSINSATTILINGGEIAGNIPGNAANVTGTVAVAHGGTGQTSYTNGQLLIGNTTGNTLTVGTLTQGSGISITNGSGTITIAATGAPPTGAAGGDLTGTYPNPTLVTTGVTASTYGGATTTPTITVDAKGRITNATNTTISGVAPGGAAGGDLTGTYPNPTLVTTGVTASTYGGATTTPTITVDAKGRITSATNTTISGVAPGGTAGGDLTGTYPSPTIGSGKVTYSKLQNESAVTLLGNPTGTSAAPSEITLGSGLSFSGTTLSATANGTVTAVSVANANGFSGTSSGGSTPQLTLSTTASGMLKGSSNAIVAATSGTDYSAGTSALGTGILKTTTGTGALSIASSSDFPTLNQNTTGNAATVTTDADLTGPVTSVGNATTITNGAVTYAKIQNETNTTLLGNPTGTSAAPSEITLGSGLSFSGTTLSATANGTVTAVSVANANGFSGTSSGGSAPQLTLSTTVSGMLKGNGTAISAATAGTDYSAGTSALGTGILKTTTGTGALSIASATDFPTLNQNTTGSAGSFTGSLSGDVSGTQTATSVDKIKGNAVPANAAGVLTNNGSGTLSWSAVGDGTVTAVSVANANGLSGTSSGGATPQLTLSTTVTGMLKGDGTAISAATAGTDYSAGTSGLGTGILKTTTGTGALSIASASDFPTLNQSTTGNAATVTTDADLTGPVTSVGNATTITDGAVTYNKIQNETNATLLGNPTGSSAAPSEITLGSGLTFSGNTLSATTSSGTVTSVSVVSANGLAGTVATASTTPAITLSTTVTGMLKGNGTAISAATAGTDYSAGTSALGTGILKTTTGTGALSIASASDFPTLNQNTTGNAATVTTDADLTGPVTSVGNATTITDGAVTYDKIQNETNATLLGNPTGTSEAPSEITLGSGLTFSGNALSATNSGTVTSVSVVSANGLAGTVATASTTPAITLSTTVTGMLKGNGTAISAATAGTDYSAGTSALGTGILKTTTGTGALSIASASDFPTLNQNTTGSAGSFTGSLSGDVSGTQTATSVDKIKGNAVPANAAGVLTNNGSGTLSWATPNSGTVTAVSVANANGFSGTSSGGATPQLTLSTTVTGMLKGNGTAISAATAGTDYSAGTSGLGTGILKTTTGTGALSIASASDFPTLNQNTTGNAATVTTDADLTGPVTSVGNATAITNSAVTYNKIQNESNGTLLGNNSGAAAAPEEITLGTGLTMTGTTLNATSTGTVTSVGLSMPGIFQVTNSPITTSGTLDVTLANESANGVFAGPATGPPSTPMFRQIVNGDIATGAIQPSALANTTVTAGSYGDGSHVGTFTVNAEGQLTAASNVAITNAASATNFTGSLSGDVSGTQTTTSVDKIKGNTVPTNAAGVLTNDGSGNLSWVTPSSGTVTAVSVANANGFSGTSSGGATPQLTLSTTVTGMLKGDGTTISAATAGTDYSAGTSGLGTGILKTTTGTGALSIASSTDFPTLNQNTTGNAATVTTDADLTGPITSVGNATTITAGAVTYANMQNETNNTLLGNTSGSAAAPEEITIGSGITVTGTTLSITGAPPTGSAGGDLVGSYPNPSIANTVTAGGDIIAALTTNGGTITNNTSGSAGSFTGSLSGDVTGTQSATSVQKIKGNTVPANAAGVLANDGSGNLSWAPGNQTVTLTGPVTGSGTGTFATTITNSAVTYANIQNETHSTLLGNPASSGSAAPSEITLGSGLSFSGGVLNTTGSGSGVLYNIPNTSAQITASSGNELFDVEYPSAGVASALGAFVKSIATSAGTATGLSVSATGSTTTNNGIVTTFSPGSASTGISIDGTAAATAGSVGLSIGVNAGANAPDVAAHFNGGITSDLQLGGGYSSAGSYALQFLGSATDPTDAAICVPEDYSNGFLSNATVSGMYGLTQATTVISVSGTSNFRAFTGSFGVRGEATGTPSSPARLIGVWGLASGVSKTNTGSIGVRAQGDSEKTVGNTNVALDINNGELTMGRTTDPNGQDDGNTTPINADPVDLQGPSGMAALSTSFASTNGPQIHQKSFTVGNQFCSSSSIVQVTVDNDADPGKATFMVQAVPGSGQFTVILTQFVMSGASSTASPTVDIGYTIINPSR